eukprot:COSAG01_NODE_71757_length_255_cov_0.506410_1_plen_37_part_01
MIEVVFVVFTWHTRATLMIVGAGVPCDDAVRRHRHFT